MTRVPLRSIIIIGKAWGVKEEIDDDRKRVEDRGCAGIGRDGQIYVTSKKKSYLVTLKRC